RARLGERRRAPAEEYGLELRRQQRALELELHQQRVNVRAVLRGPPDDRDEVAVAAAVRAEREVHVKVARHFSPSRLRTARNASGGPPPRPPFFPRFFPAFCCSGSLPLRVLSPP